MDLGDPMMNECRGAYDDHTALKNAAVMKTGEKRNDLERLAESHLVSQDTADCLLMQCPQPSNGAALILIHFLPEPLRNSKSAAEILLI